jgi:hypothetical protein
MNTNKIEKENVLMVEGKDEVNFFKALLEHLKIPNIQVIDAGGKDKFAITFSGYIQTEGALVKIKNIGFVRDAEENKAKSAFDSICGVLMKYGLPCPININEIIEQDGKKVNIFIMPNNKDRGMLEDLCLTSIEKTDILDCVDGFIKCYENKIINKENYNLSKARILAYLSAQTPIVTALGLAAQQGVWDFSHPCYDEIKTFLSDLFK